MDRGSGAIRIIDVSLVPEYRRQGIGSTLLRRVLADASVAGVPVRLSVDMANPARHLYERLGFVVTDTSSVYLSLEWRPSSTSAQAGAGGPI